MSSTRKPQKPAFRTIVLFLFFAVGVLPGLAAVVPLVSNIQNLVLESQTVSLDRQAASIADSLKFQFEIIHQGADDLARNGDVQRAIQSSLFVFAAEKSFKSFADRNPSISAIELVTAGGEVVASIGQLGQSPSPYRQSRYRQPIKGLMGVETGALITTIDLDLLEQAQQPAVGPSATLKLLGPQEAWSNDPEKLRRQIQVNAADYIPSSVTLVLEADRQTQLASANALSRRLWIGTISYFAFLAILVIYLARLITAPIATLTASVELIRGGNFQAKAPVFRYKELHEFGETLTDMAAKISEHIRTIQTQETAKRELIEIQKQFEVDVLKKQMSPHFLFNALNSIATLATIDPHQSVAMTQKLATLYRMILEATKSPSITLEREIKIVEAYLELEKIRFGDRLEFAIHSNREHREVHVPSLLMQTLAENAVKHGIAKSRAGGKVVIECREQDETFLLCTIRNSGAVYENSGAADEPGRSDSTATGLINSRRRLELMFGPTSTLTISRDQDNWTVVSFLVPLSW